MTAEKSPNQEDMESLECSVIMKTKEEHADELEVVDNALLGILAGFRLIKGLPRSEQEMKYKKAGCFWQ